jgi:hypothetical protein
MYNDRFINNKYKSQEYPKRHYLDKYYGNKHGISLQKDTEQGYVTDLKKLTPIFNQYNSMVKPYNKEEFTDYKGLAKFEGNNATQSYLSENSKDWPYKYYNNQIGHSLKNIVEDKERHYMYMKQSNETNEKNKESYNNYNKRPFRDGYAKLQKEFQIKSGPYKYYKNNNDLTLGGIYKN